MNDLVALSDAELDSVIEKLKERELGLQTNAGKKYAVSQMRECIGYLESVGYTLGEMADENMIAALWAKGLEEEIVSIGYNGVKKAVQNWAANDNSDYRSFPKIPWIKDACREIGGDPRAEKGRRVQAEAERQMELDHKREVETFKREHPDLWELIEEKAERAQGQC